MIPAFKPKLTIGPWRCPHYKSFHQKDPLRCDDPFRLWLGLMPDGDTVSCGVAADKRGPYFACKRTLAQALESYQKKLSWRARADNRKAAKKAAETREKR